MKKYRCLTISFILFLILPSCGQDNVESSIQGGGLVSLQLDTASLYQSVLPPDIGEEQAELQRLAEELTALNVKFGIAETRSDDSMRQKIWSITGSDGSELSLEASFGVGGALSELEYLRQSVPT